MQQPDNMDQKVADKSHVNSEDHEYHSDKEMLIYVGVKFFLLITIILSFDFLVELMLIIVDIIFELIHLLIEFIEEFLESILAEALPTNKHQNEVIIVNVAMIIVLYALYRFTHGVKYLYRLKRHIKVDWLIYKKRKVKSWKLLSLLSKIKLVTAYCVGFTLTFLLVF
ncbi:hypothetical protein BJAS_P0440 [Bathymodiolus japonicus methanotrophic gill symbiont]|uniref:hypothetical protein n=1 Tax=Bathymodiolus japonicus methanotrophic gill symbiont TaxID=113269 RepID=UPI001B7C39F9|nr:hypothetical protein [Bathymodiolus japonicus methanotrophic gill symbiont]GFO71175.1 hypothetical protein BJAS_P0440 [Bathymodiolus japonicus methanotrophic gill symbiont]